MDFDISPRTAALQERLLAFMDEHVYPNEHRFHEEIEANRRAGNAWQPSPVIADLKPKARAASLWNLFLPRSERAPEGFRTSITRRCARSWAACISPRRSSTAPRPTPAIWKPSSATRRES